MGVPEVRGRTRQLALLTILERVQIDRGLALGGAPIAEDQVLAVRRPRKPTPNTKTQHATLWPGLEQPLLGTAERRQNDNVSLSIQDPDERDALAVRRPRRRVLGRRIVGQTSLELPSIDWT